MYYQDQATTSYYTYRYKYKKKGRMPAIKFRDTGNVIQIQRLNAA
jgi:hypothetical protein